MTFALVWVGVPLAPALLGVVTYRLFNFWLPVIPAFAALPAVRRMRQDLPPRRQGVRPALESPDRQVSGTLGRRGSVQRMRRLLLLAIPLSALAVTATATGGRTALRELPDGQRPGRSRSAPTTRRTRRGSAVTQGHKWKISDPYSGKGFESAVAYAVAKQLGFARAKVKWVYVPFAKSFAPGKKSFDFDITQISFTPARAKVVDFSNSYYDVNQAIVVLNGTPIAKAERSIAGLQAVQARRPARDDELPVRSVDQIKPKKPARSTTRTTRPSSR